MVNYIQWNFFIRGNFYNMKSNCMNGKGRSILKYVLSYSSTQYPFKKTINHSLKWS